MSRILILAGGTGGHVMPALAVAERLRDSGVEVLWVGAADGPEATLAPRAGFEFMRIHIKGLRRSGAARLAVMPFMLAWAMLQRARILLQRKPDGALGMGGFVSGPGGLVAGLLRRPLVVHEQNAIAGLTNRHLARFATRVLSGFPAAAGIKNFTWVGNPVRREIIDIAPPEQRLSGRRGPLRLLVVGGSGGARVFNRHLPDLLGRRREEGASAGLEIWHQCGASAAGGDSRDSGKGGGGNGNGKDGAAAIDERYRAAGIRCRVNGFIDDMAAAYAWCDVAICRAGAMTVSEVCAAGVAAILVPYPYAVNDHQSGNAAYLHARAAAHLVRQEDFLGGGWLAFLDDFRRERARVVEMARAARRLAKPDAAEAVARVCREVIGA